MNEHEPEQSGCTYDYLPAAKPEPMDKFPGKRRPYRRTTDGYFIDTSGRRYWRDAAGAIRRVRK